MQELTPIQNDERDAMLLDRAAVLRVVSALRSYRAAVLQLINKGHTGCDAAHDIDALREAAIEIEHTGMLP